jgi:hypothetical protein
MTEIDEEAKVQAICDGALKARELNDVGTYIASD